MVSKYGMSEKLGPITFGHAGQEVFLGKDFSTTQHLSEKLTAVIDDEIKRIIEEAYAKCEEILTEHMEKLHKIAGVLYSEEKIEAERFEELISQTDELPKLIEGDNSSVQPQTDTDTQI
jgi:cell division protease FtsH